MVTGKLENQEDKWKLMKLNAAAAVAAKKYNTVYNKRNGNE